MSNQYNQLMESNENLGQNLNNINNNNKMYNNPNINMSGENNNNMIIEDDYNQNPNMISSGFNPYLRPSQSLKWRNIMKIDLDLIRHSGDLSLLNSNLENIIYSDITEEDIQSVPEENVIKLIKILQFLNDFLLDQRKIIKNNLNSLAQEEKKLVKNEKDLEEVVNKQDQYIQKLKKDSEERYKQIIEYKNAINELLKGGRNNLRGKNIKITDINMNINKNMNTYGYNQYNNYLKTGYKCKYCTGKVFPSEFELKKHLSDIHLITQFNEGQQILKAPQQIKSQVTMPIEVNLQPMNLMNNNNNSNSQLEKKLTDMRFEFQNQMHQFEMDKLRNQLINQKNMNDKGENYKEQMEKMGNAFNDTLKQVLGVLVNNQPQPQQPKIIKRKKKEKNNKLDEEINFIKGEIAKANLESKEFDSKIINKRNEINLLIIKKQELINTGSKVPFIPQKKIFLPSPSNNFILEKKVPQRPFEFHSGPILSDHDDTDNERKREKKIMSQMAEKTKLINIIFNKREEESEMNLPSTSNLFKNIPGQEEEPLDQFYKRYKKRDNTFIRQSKYKNYYNILPKYFDEDENINLKAKKIMREKIQQQANFFKVNIPNYKIPATIEVEELKELNKDDLKNTAEILFEKIPYLNKKEEEGEDGEKKEDEHFTSMEKLLKFERLKNFVEKINNE